MKTKKPDPDNPTFKEFLRKCEREIANGIIRGGFDTIGAKVQILIIWHNNIMKSGGFNAERP